VEIGRGQVTRTPPSVRLSTVLCAPIEGRQSSVQQAARDLALWLEIIERL
jgi:hypothetical protein